MGLPRRSIIVFVVIMLALSYVVGYITARNSQAFTLASEYCRSNPIIAEQLGEIQDLQLPFSGYGLRWGTVYGSADFRLEIRGSNGSGTVVVLLDKIGGLWAINSAKLSANGRVTVLKR